MRFTSLGSGSEGNALIVAADNTHLMLDCGFGLRETEQRLARRGLLPSDINAVLLTHEHGDHVAGAAKFCRRHGIALWATHGTLSNLRCQQDHLPAVQIIDSHQPFSIRDIEIFPFPVPHDAREPVQFCFSDGKHKLGVLTDTGSPTLHITQQLSGCDALVLECNHDAEMLMRSKYPASLKQRITSQFGHLSNDEAATLLANIDTSRLQHLVAAHLSQQNNTPEKALTCLANVLGCQPAWLAYADQSHGFDWLDIQPTGTGQPDRQPDRFMK